MNPGTKLIIMSVTAVLAVAIAIAGAVFASNNSKPILFTAGAFTALALVISVALCIHCY